MKFQVKTVGLADVLPKRYVEIPDELLNKPEVSVKIFRTDAARKYALPIYETPDASCMDIYCVNEEPIVLEPFEKCIVGSGIHVEIPPEYELLIFCRSNVVKPENGLVLTNNVAVIDSDFRGEIKLGITNTNKNTPLTISPGQKVAQCKLNKKVKIKWYEINTLDQLSKTHRGSGGLGSTGLL